MCVGIPGKIIEIKNDKAKIVQGDHSHWVDISTIKENISVGDYVVCYQNVAINKIPQKEAQEILALMHSAGDTGVKGSN